ncbi:MAG: glycosyltransferase [Pseudonocardiaceae bacterium]
MTTDLPTVYSLEPTGWTGGRIYLRTIHDAVRDMARIVTLPDLKRGYRRRRWRKLRHLTALAPRIRRLRDAGGVFVWDDLSLLWFTPAMRRRTIFVFHHHDPLHYDSAPIEPLLWRALFAALRDCAAVVCVSPYWAGQLATRGIPAQVIYNAFDLRVLDAVRAEDRQELRHRFGLPTDRTLVYVGKAVHGKGIEHAQTLLAGHPGVCLVSTGNNTIGARTYHAGWLPYLDHLRVIRACDVGLFLSTLREGWSRCAAEAVLLDLPCLTSGIAGLGDLGRLTGQPVADLPRLAEQLHARAHTSSAEIAEARQRLAAFDTRYFTDAWHHLLRTTLHSLDGNPDPARWPSGLRHARDGQPRLVT